MNLVQQALAQNNVGRAQYLLDRQISNSELRTSNSEVHSKFALRNSPDLRGWEWRYLWQQCQSDALHTLCRKSNTVFSLAISRDGKWAPLSEENDGQVSIWDLEKREEITRLPAGEGSAFVSFSPAGRLLAFASGNARPPSNSQHRLQLWDGDSGGLVAELPLEGACRGLAFSGDGQTLVTLSGTRASLESQLTLWKVSEGTKLARYPAGPVRTITGNRFALAPDLSVAAYAVGTDRIGVMDLHTGQDPGSLSSHSVRSYWRA